MTLSEVNSKYRYLSDDVKYNTKFDVWEIPEEVDGVIESDCESYARLLKSKVGMFKDWDYWYCKLNGIGHCVLIKNNDVIDCNVREVLTLDQYCKMFTVTELSKYSTFEVISKILFSKGFLLWKKFSK